jgi:hypothetical protein
MITRRTDHRYRRGSLVAVVAFVVSLNSSSCFCGADGGLLCLSRSSRLAPLFIHTLTADTTNIGLFAGDSSTVDISLQSTAPSRPWAVAIDPTSVPPRVTASLSSDSTDPGQPITLTIEVSINAAPTVGRADSLVIHASSNGAQARLAIALTVLIPFQLSPLPGVSLARGNSTNVFVAFQRAASFDGGVVFPTVIHPSVDVDFVPNVVNASSTTMQLRDITPTAAPGATTLQVVAVFGGYADTVLVTVNFTAPPQDFSLATLLPSVTTSPGNTVFVDVRVRRVLATIGAVDLDVQGAPAGVGLLFSPDPAPDSVATLRVVVNANAPVGTHPLTLRGTANGIVRTAPLSLTIVAPGFAITLHPIRVALNPGGAAVSVAVAVTRTGATGPVALSIAGLPTGVTATFNPPNTNFGSSELTLQASAGAPAVFTTAQVQGVIGAETQSVPLAVDVNQTGSFAIAASPATTTAISFGFGETGINITRDPGFTAAVTLAQGNAWPKGFVDFFQPASVTGTSSQLSFDVAGFVLPGPYTLEVEGRSGTLRRRATIAVQVTQYRPPDGFVMSVESPMTVSAGDSVDAVLVVSRAFTFTAPLTFSVGTLPNGISVSVLPSSVPGIAATVRVRAAPGTLLGTHTLTFTGSGGGTSATSQMQLTVGPSVPP